MCPLQKNPGNPQADVWHVLLRGVEKQSGQPCVSWQGISDVVSQASPTLHEGSGSGKLSTLSSRCTSQCTPIVFCHMASYASPFWTHHRQTTAANRQLMTLHYIALPSKLSDKKKQYEEQTQAISKLKWEFELFHTYVIMHIALLITFHWDSKDVLNLPDPLPFLQCGVGPQTYIECCIYLCECVGQAKHLVQGIL